MTDTAGSGGMAGVSLRSMAVSGATAMALVLSACGDGDGDDGGVPVVTTPPTALPPPTTTPPGPTPAPTPAPTVTAVTQRVVATFENPWAMVFLPDGRMLVTEKPGRLQLVTQDGAKAEVSGVPAVASSGQLGLHDVVLDPSHASNGRVWLSYAEAATGGQRLAVARATLTASGTPRLEGLTVVWRAVPTTTGGHPGGRMAFSPDGRFLFVTSGDRQQKAPAQDPSATLGKIVRLDLEGAPAAGNPFASGPRPETWSLGHRNPYGLVFASDGRLFQSEMGPEGGDEFNLIEPGRNYGWPLVSEGNDYGGAPIPRHSTDARFAAPLVSWTPVISPGGMIQYRGTRFSGWTGDFLLAGLSQQGLVRVRVSGSTATEAARLSLGARIREVEEAPDGSIWVLQDGAGGRLVQLLPA